MKGNKLVKLMAFVLLVTVLAIILVSGTYAKYTTSATGTDTAKVALWSIKINDEDIAKAETKELTVDLFSTITNTDGTDEKNVSAIDGSLIAPGTMGSFNLVSIENASEVNATYSVTYTLLYVISSLTTAFTYISSPSFIKALTFLSLYSSPLIPSASYIPSSPVTILCES